MDKTITRSDLADAVHQQIGLSHNECSHLVSSVLEEVTECLISGDSVKLSSFGTFSVQSKNERLGRNPKTGVEAVITPRRVLSFRPSNLMKKLINSAYWFRKHLVPIKRYQKCRCNWMFPLMFSDSGKANSQS